MKLLMIILSLTSASAFAAPKLSPIFDGEFNMDTAACWLANKQSETMVYSIDQNNIKIKLDSTIIALTAQSASSKFSFLECGKNYEFSSADGKTKVKLELAKSKSKNCEAGLSLTSSKGKIALKGLKLSCSN